ncbi:hypothetical protein A7P54_01935 [Acinetobacter sp. Ac_3412]|uniref:hypothetical protein n=1 Tax=Acinetobacter sp. Ac_3412 TaxID=1848935 RepID=UPI00148FF3DA|nr:hypothetical protein [Acinetobacter sp. Ac_3412]NNP75176.1 hypothetical protein [Acinetobacter sp. Ac_3412]
MHLNLFIYGYKNSKLLKLYEILCEIEQTIGIKTSKFHYLYLLESNKANHPKDHKAKSISLKNLEIGIRSGEILSFSMGTTQDLKDLEGYFAYIQDEKHVIHPHINLHIPQKYADIIQESLRQLIIASEANYAFQTSTESALAGISYLFNAGTYKVHKNEKSNFSWYTVHHNIIQQPRMIYPVNYFTQNQLLFSINDCTLWDFITKTFGKNSLKPLGQNLFVFNVSLEQLFNVNNKFSAAGFLISLC